MTHREEEEALPDARLLAEAEELLTAYPDADLLGDYGKEGSRFRALTAVEGLTLKDAWEMAHYRELIDAAAKAAAREENRRVAASLSARGARPAEVGASGAGGFVAPHTVPEALTREGRRELARRAARGEEIRF